MISKYDDKVLVEAYIKYGSTTRAAKNVGCSYETVRRSLISSVIKGKEQKTQTVLRICVKKISSESFRERFF